LTPPLTGLTPELTSLPFDLAAKLALSNPQHKAFAAIGKRAVTLSTEANRNNFFIAFE